MSRSLFLLICICLLFGGALKVCAEETGTVLLDDYLPPAIESHPTHSPQVYEVDGQLIELPPLEEELHWHGGSSLYEPSDYTNKLHHPHCEESHHEPLRLPECWCEPQPLSCPEDYLGSHLIDWHCDLKWFGRDGYAWEPRLVGYGSYELFGAFYEANNRRRDGIGHQLIVDFDLALTGTERLHVQFRPVGEENSGGSFWQLNDPTRSIDHSTGIPQRWWIEGELQSLFSSLIGDERKQIDINYTAGRFPMLLHNGLLMNDEIIGVMLGKNTITSTPLSNLNIQAFYAIDEVDSFPRSGELYGVHLSGDYRHAFLKATFARLERDAGTADLESNWFAFSATKFFGPLTLAGRTMLKDGSGTGNGDGQLYVLESSFTRLPPHLIEELTGIELMVAYLNIFKANDQWTPISGGNFSRLRNAFTVNPLLNLSATTLPTDSHGASLGVQLFRHHQDESLIPEVAYEEQSADAVWGVGLRYQKKLNARMFLELRGIKSWSDNVALEREGAFASTFIIF